MIIEATICLFVGFLLGAATIVFICTGLTVLAIIFASVFLLLFLYVANVLRSLCYVL